MAKNLKIKIKNTQLAKAAGFDKFKAKLASELDKDKEAKVVEKPAQPQEEELKPRRIRAKSKSSFAPPEHDEEQVVSPPIEELQPEEGIVEPVEIEVVEEKVHEKIEEKAVVKPEAYEKLGPTGRHVKDLLPPPPKKKEAEKAVEQTTAKQEPAKKEGVKEDESAAAQARKGKKIREFKDLKPARRQQLKSFDARDRQGLSESDEERWRKKRAGKPQKSMREEMIIRPTHLRVRVPITFKELAAEMKVKASEIIQKLFLHGMIYTVNDTIDDDTTIQFIGNEFNCEIVIDTREAERIQITSQSTREEIRTTETSELKIRPPVVAFMGHVDHGKTSLIDAIRKTNVASGEAGAITQHIGAFRCKTAVGDLTILDTPGHEAFSAMRARGAIVTDIVVLVVAGDEGIREQTLEAIQHAKAAGVTIVVAINKCDKPSFNAENVYRELSEANLLPESWGGQIITVNTSAVTGQGIPELLEMLALQAEVLELRANPFARARGTVLESELHKGLGCVATVLVQNGTLKRGDALVFESHWGRVKTMHDEYGVLLEEAGPSTPVEITGLSGLPAAGDPFIAVKSDKEARSVVEARQVGRETRALQQKKAAPSLEKLLQKEAGEKKLLKLILRADVQGSVEALKTSIMKITSDKAEVEVIFTGVGEVSESDIQLASASRAVIIGFHTRIESHAESLIKELGVTVRLFDIIYHAIDNVKEIMLGMLDKLAEERETGAAEVQAVFKSSHLGVIAGCIVTDGVISRNHRIRVVRGGQIIWRGAIASIRRVKEDVKEVKKGIECGILLDGFTDVLAEDKLQAYEIVYITQKL